MKATRKSKQAGQTFSQVIIQRSAGGFPGLLPQAVYRACLKGRFLVRLGVPLGFGIAKFGIGTKLGNGLGKVLNLGEKGINALTRHFQSGFSGGILNKLQGGSFSKGFLNGIKGSAIFTAAVSVGRWVVNRVSDAVHWSKLKRFKSNSEIEAAYDRSVDTYGSSSGSIKLSDDLAFQYEVSGPSGYARQVDSHLRSIANTPSGNELLTGLANSGDTTRIFFTDGASQASSRGVFDFSWSQNTIAFNPDVLEAPILFETRNGQLISVGFKPENVLAHELVHAWQNENYFGGNLPRVGGKFSPSLIGEVQAVRFVNTLRLQQGLNYIRITYHPYLGAGNPLPPRVDSIGSHR